MAVRGRFPRRILAKRKPGNLPGWLRVRTTKSPQRRYCHPLTAREFYVIECAGEYAALLSRVGGAAIYGSNSKAAMCRGLIAPKWRRSSVATRVCRSRSARATTAASTNPSGQSPYCAHSSRTRG